MNKIPFKNPHLKPGKINIQGDYKCYGRLHKFTDKEVIWKQKLNAHHCKQQLKK